VSEHPKKLGGEREGEAESGVEQGEDDSWPKAGIGDGNPTLLWYLA